MFLNSPAAQKRLNLPFTMPPPVGGLNAISSVMSMPIADAVLLENWIPYPDRLVMREGASNHVTGFGATVKRLWAYASPTGAETLWATTDSGVYAATVAGAVGATVMALTQGNTIGTVFSTGASNYLILVNATDTMKQYDGTTWSSVATLGATSTVTYSYVAAYRQRLFLIQRNSLILEYLAVNSISGATTTYNLGSILRRGGYLVAMETWTLDGGNGPDDMLAIVTSMGEVAVFSGNDPATWSLKGVYYIGRPLGQMPLFKYGGDLLFLSEAGLFPLSKAVLAASIDRTSAISKKIQPVFTQAGRDYFSNAGWQLAAMPEIPLLIANIPGTTQRFQYCMHLETGAWTVFSGWDAYCFARMGGRMYFGTANKVAVVGGVSDFGANIAATMLSAYSRLGYPRNKIIKLIRPYLQSNGTYSYNIGVANDFGSSPVSTQINPITSGTAALWGTAVWGSAVWTGGSTVLNDWRTLPDLYAGWKSLYLQVVSNTVQVEYLGSDLRLMPGTDF